MEYTLPFTKNKNVKKGAKGFYQFAKLNNELVGLSDHIMEATGQPLVDQNLNFVVFEIKMNPDEVNYINTNGLNTEEGQVGKNISFPPGNSNSVGSIEIKASWKIMVPGVDDSTKFYCRRATIFVPAAQSVTHQNLYLNETVGLVAMHIIHKTTKFPLWVWTTFEHVNNAPLIGHVDPSIAYSFYNNQCPNCSTNVAPTAQGNNFIWRIQPSALTSHRFVSVRTVLL